MRVAAQWLHDRRGGVGVLVALAMPLLIGFAAFAVDLGSATLDSRRLQGIADAAAIAAAGDPDHADTLARASVASAGWSRAIAVTTRVGRYRRDPAVAVGARFVPGSAGADAVRVSLNATSPAFFATIFGSHGIAIGRAATATRQRLASLSIGTRLASVNGGLANAYLSALTGSSVALSAVSYDALAGADVDLFGFLGALNTSASLKAASFGEIAAARVTQGQALGALASALDARGNGSAAGAVRTLALTAPGRSLSLSALIDPGPYGAQATGGSGVARVNAMALVTALVQLASPTRQVALDLGASTGLSSSKVTLAVGERPQQSPWIAIGTDGSVVVRTAQARLYVDQQLTPAPLPGLLGTIGVRVPLFVELASGEARLTAIDCASAASAGVSVEARPSPGTAAIAALDPARLSDFSQPVALSPARLVDLAVVQVDGKATIDLGQAEPWQPLRFSAADIAAGTSRTVSSGTVVTSVAGSLAQRLTLSARVIGLPLPVGPLLSGVGSRVAAAAPGLDALLDLATGTLGVHVGQADVRVTGMRCGVGALVA